MRNFNFTCLKLTRLTALIMVTNMSAFAEEVATILQPSRSPLISFRVVFSSGSADDPNGQEGLAAMTANLLAKGGTRTQSYDQILEAMYPMATSFDVQVDKEMTTFVGSTHLDNLDRYYNLIRGMLLEPGFREDDFTRLKTDAINFLKVSLREGNDEELAKEELYNLIYRGHPYGHQNAGSVTALQKLRLEDLRAFYATHYLRGNITLGLAGAYPDSFPSKLRHDFSILPDKRLAPSVLPQSEKISGLHLEIIQRETRSTAISIGFPLDVRRGDPDWPALALINSYFGQHRSSSSHLYQRLREARGLNYGDYSYIEYFPRGMFQFQPDPNLGRRQQIFQIWIRPVEPQNGLFALRAALFEYEKLLQEGLSQAAFDATKQFLSKDVNVLLQTQDARLGYAIDSRYYGIAPFDKYLQSALARLTVEEVNQALRRHFTLDQTRMVVVTRDARSFQESILAGRPTPILYNSTKPSEIIAEDKIIEQLPVPLRPEAITIRPVGEIFE